MIDGRTERLVIAALALLALATVVGGIVLAWNDRGLPGEIIAIGSAAAGAIGGILARPSADASQPVVVTGAPDSEPVPVVETPAKAPAARKRR
jgi:hypothetical protein